MTNKIKESNITDSAVTTAKLADSAVTNAKITGNVNFKNILINGDMSIAQRSTSKSSANTQAYHCTDRWFNVGMTIGTWTISQSTDVPAGQGFAKSLKYDCTTAEASPGTGDQLHFSQRIEGQNLQYLKKGTSNAESLTLSFWVKTNKTGTYQVNLRDKDNTRIIGQTYTVSSADTWEKKTLTFAGDTTGTLDIDNAQSLALLWWLSAGSNYTSGTLQTSWGSQVTANRAVSTQVNLADSTANEFFITGIQLEAGTTASDFEFLPLDVNLQRCQRYFYVFGDRRTSGAFPIVDQKSIGLGVTHYPNQCVVSIPMKVNMRTSPSIDQVSGTDFYDYYHGQASDTFDSFNGISSTGEAQQIIRNTNQISASVNNCGIVYINGTDAYTAFDAEL